MKSKLLFLLICVSLVSCGSSIQLNSDELSEINSSTGFYFNNYAYMSEQTHYRFSSLLDAFNIDEVPQGKVYVDFNDEEELRVSYQNRRGKLISNTYEGEFKDNYYQIYFERINLGIPPFYWQTKIDRMRIAINKEGNLVIDHKYKNGKYYFFGLIFQSVSDDLYYDRDVHKNRQQVFFKREDISTDEVSKDFRLFL